MIQKQRKKSQKKMQIIKYIMETYIMQNLKKQKQKKKKYLRIIILKNMKVIVNKVMI